MSDLLRNSFSNIGERNTIRPGSVAEASLRSQSIGTDFQSMLQDQLSRNAAESQEAVQFSKHARQRVEQRGIELTDSFLKDLSTAVAKGREKGSKDMVVIDRNGAFIVNVPNNIVVTAISGEEMKENVFTNIDSAVII
ncbi:MAG: TIGR02530 family flagellar biosynthesis protein [Anaerovoracaceae bacterium]